MKVLYIAGVGRSGSTLLERMLGAVPGSVNAGELNAIFSRVSREDQRCGCGVAFSACTFWSEVGAKAFGGWAAVTQRMSELQPRVVRQRHVPLMATRFAPASYLRDLQEYVEVYRRLYSAVSQVSGADVVVDASKSTSQVIALRRVGGLDLRVVNLVRDSRGVANSWSKAGIRKPQSTDGAVMGTYAPHRLAALWTALQIESGVVQATTPWSTRIRYEDLVARPLSTVAHLLAEVGIPPEPGALDHIVGRSVHLSASHGLAGSRTRFTAGRIELDADDAWRTTMPVGNRRVVTAATLPLLITYGYVGRWPLRTTTQPAPEQLV